MERKLASIRKIQEIKLIEGADKICAYRVDGWWVVDSINKYNVGELVVYYEIDSFLPITPQFEFLRKSSIKKMGEREGFRLKTIKLKGQLSQGLLTKIPMGLIVPPKENDDMTELLGIVKYEPPIPAELAGEIRGSFPSFIPKTDEVRIQNFESEVGMSIANERVYVTEKVDGTSFTCYVNKGEFGVCGRNWELKETQGNSLWRMANKLNLREKLLSLNRNIALQGELFGSGINGNWYKLNDHQLMFFTGYDIDNQKRLTFKELINLLDSLQLESVPVIDYFATIPYSTMSEIIEWALLYAESESNINTAVENEGIVIRGLEKEFSFKAISNKWLLSEK
jgi:RNA ligase (TIGR02306 family)